MRVVAIDEPRSLALCGDERGARLSIGVALLMPVAVGEVLLVHAGIAIARADAQAQAGASEQASGRIQPTGRGAHD